MNHCNCKTLNRTLDTFCMVFLVVGCRPKKAEPEFLFRTALLVNENHTWYKAFAHFGEILEERSQGRIKVELYSSEQLAKEIEAIRLIQLHEDLRLVNGICGFREPFRLYSDYRTYPPRPFQVNYRTLAIINT